MKLARVYHNYDFQNPGESLPPHPDDSWTRFVCISDTHSRRYPLPEGDVLLHAGDLTRYGDPHELEETLEWLRSLSHPMKIIVAGNHDLSLDDRLLLHDRVILDLDSLRDIRTKMRSQELRDAGIYYLEHDSLSFQTPSGRSWKAYGLPSSPRYARGAFQYSTPDEAQDIYNNVPTDTEILLTHTPPYRILDKTRKGCHAGCRVLESRLQKLKECRLHVFGHIHEAYGAEIATNGRVHVNGALPHASCVTVVDLKD